MTYKLVDLYIDKVIGEYDSSDGADKAMSRLYPEAGRYEIQSPVVQKPTAKKTRVKKKD